MHVFSVNWPADTFCLINSYWLHFLYYFFGAWGAQHMLQHMEKFKAEPRHHA